MFATLMVACVLMGCITLSAVLVIRNAANGREAVRKMEFAVANMLAQRVGGALRWKKSDLVTEGIAEVGKSLPKLFAGVSTYTNDGHLLSWHSETAASFEFESVADQVGEWVAATGVTSKIIDEHYLIILPVEVTKRGKTNRVGTLVLAFSDVEIEAQQAETIALAGIITALIVSVLAIVIVVLLRSKIITPLRAVTDVTLRLADGELEIDVPYRARRDEIGALANSITVFKDNALRMSELEDERVLAERATEEARAKERLEMAADLETEVSGTISQIQTSLSRLRGASEQLGRNAQSTADESEVASGVSNDNEMVVQSISGASQQLDSSISEIAKQVAQAAEVSHQAVDEARQTNNRVQNLSQAAERIGEVVDLINKIAQQTNLLALNATIESARAGEAGKGFAVVANEVKTLAAQTAKATEDIREQILGIQTETKASVHAIGLVSEIIGQISELSVAVAGSVEEQGVATGEIANNISRSAERNSEINNSIATVSSIAKETGEAADLVMREISSVTGDCNELEAAIQGFLGRIGNTAGGAAKTAMKV